MELNLSFGSALLVRRMSLRFLAVVLSSIILAAPLAHAATCESLSHLVLPDTKITLAKSETAETYKPGVIEAPGPPLSGPHWIINFPTKKHWRQPSQLQWIVEGLQDLRRVIDEKSIHSIALPPLGAGNGGLDWGEVRPIVEKSLSDLKDVEVLVYEPTDKYQNVQKPTGVEELTPARVLIAEMIRRYWVLGIECTYLEVQKLGWFLERSIHSLGVEDPLKLQFQADKYGPYSDRLRHLLDKLDGTYLHCNKRLSDAGPSDTIWFDQDRKRYVDLFLHQTDAKPLNRILDLTAKRIDGFESSLGMELLATVDWLIDRENVEPTLEAIREGLRRWPAGEASAERKLRLFNDRFIKLALDRLSASAA
jgi:hypothetical protein